MPRSRPEAHANGAGHLPPPHLAPAELPGDNYLMLVVKTGLGPGGVEEKDLHSLSRKHHGRRTDPAAAG